MNFFVQGSKVRVFILQYTNRADYQIILIIIVHIFISIYLFFNQWQYLTLKLKGAWNIFQII